MYSLSLHHHRRTEGHKIKLWKDFGFIYGIKRNYYIQTYAQKIQKQKQNKKKKLV